MVRKMVKPEMKKGIETYHAQKVAAFKAQKGCFMRLMKIDASLTCASMNAVPSFATKVGNKT